MPDRPEENGLGKSEKDDLSSSAVRIDVSASWYQRSVGIDDFISVEDVNPNVDTGYGDDRGTEILS